MYDSLLVSFLISEQLSQLRSQQSYISLSLKSINHYLFLFYDRFNEYNIKHVFRE